MKVLLTPVLLLLLQSQVMYGRQRLPRVKVKESTVHTIKLPAQPYQLKNGSYVSNPLTGGDANINSLLSFLKRTNILKVSTNFTSNGRPMGVSTGLNIQELSPIGGLSPASVISTSTENPKSEVSRLPTTSSTMSSTPRVTTRTSTKMTTTTAKVTTAVRETSSPKLTTTSTTVTTTETTSSTTSPAKVPVPTLILAPHRAVMWWPSLLPWHHQAHNPLFPLSPHHHSPPLRFPPRYASPPRAPSQEKHRVPASTTPLYLSTWLLPSHLLYKYTNH